MRAARERVAESLPSKDDVRRESLAVIRDAVMHAFAPAVEKVAEYAGGIGVAFDPNPMTFPATSPPSAYMAPVVPQPLDPCRGKGTGCTCDDCIPF